MNQNGSYQPHSYQPSVAASARKSRLWLWLLLIPVLLIVGLVVVLIMFVGAGWLYHLSGNKTAVTADERALVLDIEALAEWMDYVPDLSKEKSSKITYFDHSHEIEYEYDDSDNGVYLNYLVNRQSDQASVKAVYLPLWASMRVGLKIGDAAATLEERNDLFQWGEESRFAILKIGEEPFGNLFISRQGNHVAYCIISGVYFDDTDSITELMVPYLEKLRERETK